MYTSVMPSRMSVSRTAIAAPMPYLPCANDWMYDHTPRLKTSLFPPLPPGMR
ncbi:Uncharacterised protein [Mycobacteroides abscessus]|nr:Uncharacterised protein [Mycobacteroides abscessus]